MEAAAKSNLKPVSLELGGKSPLIIFNDADVNLATTLAWNAAMFNKANAPPSPLLSPPRVFEGLVRLQGEICVAGSRVFVQEGIYDEFVKVILEKAKTWKVGDPFDPTVNQGPQVILLVYLN